MRRIEAIADIYQHYNSEETFFILSNGLTSREASHFLPRGNAFYLIHAMGEAFSVGIGLACSKPDLKVVVIDGDGNALMGMASWCMHDVKNLEYYVLRNGSYDTTGFQPLPDFPAVPDWCHIVDIESAKEETPNPPSPELIYQNCTNWLKKWI